jgi:hypothetical protein
VNIMTEVPHIESGDEPMRWRPAAPGTGEDEVPMSSADEDERAQLPQGQDRSRVLRFAVGIFIAVLICSGSAVAWRTYSDPTTPVPGPPSGSISPPEQAPQPTSNVENAQKTAELLAILQADKETMAKLTAALQTQTQQLSHQHNQVAELHAEIAAMRERQTSQQAELQRLSGALAAQKAARKKAQAAHPKQSADAAQATAGTKRQAEVGTAAAAVQRPPTELTTPLR